MPNVRFQDRPMGRAMAEVGSKAVNGQARWYSYNDAALKKFLDITLRLVFLFCS